MRNFARLCCSILLVLGAANSVHAQEDIPPSPIVKTALVVDAPMLQQDNVVWAAVDFTIPEHWHIYWQNPGDSGIPTTYTWQLPDGVTAGDITWPSPERLGVSGLMNYGYSNHVTLPVPLTPAKDGAGGKFSVTAKWLVCRDVCVPEKATLEGTLPGETANAKKLIEDAVMRAPQVAVHTSAAYQVHGDTVMLVLSGPEILPENATKITSAFFIPLEDGVITNADAQAFSLSKDGKALVFTMKRGTQDTVANWHGVVQLTRDGKLSNIAVAATRQGVDAAATTPAPAAADHVTLIVALTLAFLGGLILNVMPCVLPILALKALAITKKSGLSRRAAAKQGLFYTLGVLVSFLAIAGLMLSLKASGAAIGWGFQLQNMGFVAVLAIIMLLVGANLLGLFQLPVIFGRQAMELDEERTTGSFFTGVLAVLVATPCSAPFMATAIGATLSLPMAQALLVFAVLGLGMASPFLLISLWPAARRLLPKPGAWMHRFKQILAIPMLATAAWLVWVLVQMHGGAMKLDMTHVMYTPSALQQLRDDGKPVLVDATAAWCLTCKVNERVALQSPAMQEFLKAKNVTLMVADWTSSDPDITAFLAQFGRNGVPLYVYYGPHAEPVVLPQILTPSIVREAVDAHG